MPSHPLILCLKNCFNFIAHIHIFVIVTHVNILRILVWNMKLNMKYSWRYSKTGMIHITI